MQRGRIELPFLLQIAQFSLSYARPVCLNVYITVDNLNRGLDKCNFNAYVR